MRKALQAGARIAAIIRPVVLLIEVAHNIGRGLENVDMKKYGFISLSFTLLTCVSFDKVICADEPQEQVANTKNDESSKAEENKKTKESMGIEKTIEVNSVNFIKLKSKPHEIFIPTPEIADVDMLNDSSLYLMGLAPGTTSLVVHDKDSNIIANYKITVTYPIKAIKSAIIEMYPDTNVDIVSLDNSLLLKGNVPSPESAAGVQGIVERFVPSNKIINKLSIETGTQVMLKVKIAEVSRNLTKSLGINWRAISHGKDIQGMHYGFMAGDASAFPKFTEEFAELKEEFSKESRILGKTVSGGRWLAHGGGANGLSGLIEALATESFASVLAEPTLIALSGKKATFKAGGEQGYEVKQTGGDVTTTEFKSWGTSIEFTPVVLSENRINITVKPVVSTVVFDNEKTGVPSLTTKEAETTVELGSGQSLAIAGLIQTNKNSSSSETPFLADIPFIGSFFRNSNVSTMEKELIIIVTVYVVKPASKQLKVPTDMAPKLYSPLESVITRKFHRNIKKSYSAGFALK
jgi:pilus assembly protein CpaC